MGGLFVHNLDYVFLVYGLSFFVLGSVCVSFVGHDRRVLWLALAGFGFVHGGCEWCDLLALLLGDSPWFGGFRLAAKAASFIILAVFCLRAPGRLPAYVIAAPVLTAIVLAFLLASRGSLREGEDVVRWLIGLPACLGTALILWRAAALEDGSGRIRLGTVAAAFAVYGLATGAVVPASGLVPAGLPTHESFMALFGVPVQLVRGVTAIVAATALWSYQVGKAAPGETSAAMHRHFRRTVIFLAAVVAAGAVAAGPVSSAQITPEIHRLILIVGILVVTILILANYISVEARLNAEYFAEQKRGLLEEMAKSLEEARIRAESADRIKSHFLSIISHELRTPLNAVLGFSELLRDRPITPGSPTPGAENPDQIREYADYIHGAGEHLLTMINEIIVLSKIGAGDMEINPVSLPVARLLADTVRLAAKAAAMHGLDLAVEVADPELTVWADERAARQMLFNLLSNAIKFTQRGGSITVSARPAPFGGVLLAVADSGIGVSPDDLGRILKPFEQVDRRLNRERGGSGLGLPLVQGLLSLHGGRLDIVSATGTGSTFTIWLPPAPEGCDRSDPEPGQSRFAFYDNSNSMQ